MSVKDKAELRQQMWDRLEQASVVRFPGAHGRIPNFAGVRAAGADSGRAREEGRQDDVQTIPSRAQLFGQT